MAGCGRKAPPIWLEPAELPAPSGLTALYGDDVGVRISWDYPVEIEPYIEGFRIEKYEGSNILSSSITRKNYYQFPDDGGYSYRVSVIGKRRGVKPVVSPMIKPPAISASAAPAGLSAEMTTDGLMLKWKTVRGATAYNVYKGLKGSSEPDEPAGENITATAFVDADAVAGEGEATFYSVRALRQSEEGGVRTVVLGPASGSLEIDADIFRPAAPTGVDIARSEGKVLVYWDISPEKWVEGYRVYRVDSEGERHRVATTVTPAYSETAPGHTGVGYAVSAFGKSLEGPLSPTVRVKSPSPR
jgi:hypothetical protein